MFDPAQYQQAVSNYSKTGIRAFENYTFRTIDWEKDIKNKNTIFVGPPDVFSGEKQELVESMYPDGTKAIEVVKPLYWKKISANYYLVSGKLKVVSFYPNNSSLLAFYFEIGLAFLSSALSISSNILEALTYGSFSNITTISLFFLPSPFNLIIFYLA